MQHVVLAAENRTVRYLRPRLEINLGSIGKGYALDRAARFCGTQGIAVPRLLHGGHSSVYAIGSEPEERLGGWRVGIKYPWDTNAGWQ